MLQKNVLCFLLLVSSGNFLYGTHLKGGYVHASHVSENKFFLKVVLYLELETNVPSEEKLSLLISGVGELLLPKISEQSVEEKGVKVLIYGMNHAFGVPALYQLTAVSSNRTGTLNSPTSNLFLLFTTLDTRLEANQIQEPSLPPMQAGLFEAYEVPLPERDSDGDSLSYQLSKVYTRLGSVPEPEPEYLFPNEVERKGIFKIRNGRLLWDAPTLVGKYTCAYIRNEWRDGRVIGKTLVEFTVDVRDNGASPEGIPDFEEVISSIDGLVTAVNGDVKGGTVLTLYPVPAKQYLHTAAESAKPLRHRFDLIDATGRVLQQFDTGSEENRCEYIFPVYRLAPGMYFIRVQTEEGMVSRRFVKP